MAKMLTTLVLAVCCSVEALTAARGWAPAQMARPAAAARASPVMQFGKKKLSPEEVRPRGLQKSATGCGTRHVSDAVAPRFSTS